MSPLPLENGGGFAATVPDLPGCVGDGGSPDEAPFNVQDAISEWIDMATLMGRPLPVPTPPHALA